MPFYLLCLSYGMVAASVALWASRSAVPEVAARMDAMVARALEAMRVARALEYARDAMDSLRTRAGGWFASSA